jgi:dimethylhistidine N-methyltransferase
VATTPASPPDASDDASDDAAAASTLPLLDLGPAETETLREAVLAGLSRDGQKEIPSKFLYDKRGSELFDAICELDAYYPTRTELGILRAHLDAITGALGDDVLLVEFGSGSSRKTRLLLDRLEGTLAGYVPIDISRGHLVEAAEALADAFPDVPVLPVCADYTAALKLPDPGRPVARRVIYYPGSTIGNFRPAEAVPFLTRAARLAGAGGGLLIGVDLRKDADVLRRAYNDPEGVTAAFNLNLLRRLNRELGATFDLAAFRHEARWNDADGCIEMHLVSREAQTVTVAGRTVAFAAGESIRTEYSFKYTLDGFAALAAEAGWSVETVWTDARAYFSVQYLTVTA